ncbi:MAG: cbb3-type cytochrome c oxidase subunit I [Clostridia bacterium]|jgi:nitric oxide reductase subunit B|nr:cbb3-type cytochrome c oxidase subunit I [Clostridia bacterium]
MLKWLFSKAKKLILPKNKNNKKKQKKDYLTKQIAIPYFLLTILAMAAHGAVANMGSLEYIFPDMPAPISFEAGRAVHLNLSLFWPVFGLIGAVYYFLPEEAETELHSPLLALIQLGLMVVVGLGIVISLAFGLTEGREYLEAVRPFDVGILIILVMFSYNVIRTVIKSKHQTNRPTLVLMAFSLVLMIFLFIPTMFFLGSIILDEIFRWWVVHLWVETSMQLIAAAIIAAFLIYITSVKRKIIYFWLYVEAVLVLIAGFFATGHHYLWIGTPGYWFTIGGIFGALQPVPIFIIAYTAYKSISTGIPVQHHRWPLYFIFNAVFWNIVGAGLFGLVLTVPAINAYTHGTLITSAHAHLALFGTFGILAIAVSYFGILEWIGDKYINKSYSFASLLMLNIGLVLMGVALILAGFVQIYLVRVVGMEFSQSLFYLRPYMAARGIGGAIFALGGIVFAGHLFYGIIKAAPSFKLVAILKGAKAAQDKLKGDKSQGGQGTKCGEENKGAQGGKKGNKKTNTNQQEKGQPKSSNQWDKKESKKSLMRNYPPRKVVFRFKDFK